MEDYYARLEIRPDATATDIRAAYRRLALKWHPDKNPNNQKEANRKFKQMAAAYGVLSNPVRRAEYDALKLCRQRPRRGRQETYYSDWQDHRAQQRRYDEDVFNDLSMDFSNGFFNNLFSGFFEAFKVDPSFRRGRGGSFIYTPATETRSSFFTMSSYSTVYVNGKEIVTRTRTANNQEITEVFENGILSSSTTRYVSFWTELIKTLVMKSVDLGLWLLDLYVNL